MKRLITERDVQQMAPGSKLELGSDTIVTPSARDLAFARRIELVEWGTAATSSAVAPAANSSCGCDGCKAGGRCDCGQVQGPWPKLADGDYLIEVRNGEVRLRPIER